MHPLIGRLLAERDEVRLIFLRNYAVEARIGIHDFERAGPQRLLVNVQLVVGGPAPEADEIGQVLDYDFLRDEIARRVGSRHYNLQESLVHEIADLCLARPEVLAVGVSTEKPDVYPDCEAVGYSYARVKRPLPGGGADAQGMGSQGAA
jgi:dihydroneopterin aldolase